MKSKKDYFFVLLQFLLFIAYLFEFDTLTIELSNALKLTLLGLTVFGGLITLTAILQLNTKLSPFPTPKENSSLVTNGVFKWVRHPIYTGLILSFVCYSLYHESLYKLCISLVLTILFHFKVKYEESRIIEKFPEYIEHKKTGRLFPLL